MRNDYPLDREIGERVERWEQSFRVGFVDEDV